MKSLLIIGGTGFLGKSFIDSFLKKKLKGVSKIFILSRKYKKNKKNIYYLKGDISKINQIPICNYTIFAAEQAETRNYRLSNKKNIINFCNIIKTIKYKGKILYISSGAYYGISKFNKIKFKENTKIANIKKCKYKKYTIQKRFSEKKIKALSTLGYKVSIARCFSFIGKYLPKNKGYFISDLIVSIKNKKKVIINSKINIIRSYMYSDDMVIWLMKMLKNTNNSCSIYNVGSDKKISIFKLAEFICKKYRLPLEKFNKTSLVKFNSYVPNINKAKKLLNLKIKYNINDSIKKILEHDKNRVN